MKRTSTSLFAAAVLLFAFHAAARAQTITIDSISGTTFCLGDSDPVSVTFTVTGTWGHKNAFTLQLSDSSGNFNNGFSNIGSVIDTAPGTFTIVSSIPSPSFISDHYRFRVMGANPYTTSVDNGSNVTVGIIPNSPTFDFRVNDYGTTGVGLSNIGFIGASFTNAIAFMPSPPPTIDSVFCDLGAGASPANISGAYSVYSRGTVVPSIPSISYSTGGDKYINIREVSSTGCVSMAYDTLHIFDCTPPVIPPTATVIDSNTIIHEYEKGTFWINPGVTVIVETYPGADTIFAESGSTVLVGENCLIYLKRGAQLQWAYGYAPNGDNIIIYDSEASYPIAPSGVQVAFECDSLIFDYSVAPPNVVMHINDGALVTPPPPAAQIEILPNPTTGTVALENVPAYASVTAMNVLGQTVTQTKASGSGNVTFDLSQFAPGTYYIRIASGGGVVTKKVVKQ